MPAGKGPRKDRGERREEALRPSRCLGYDRDALGVHLLTRGAHGLAAAQFRRAIWLNPYEPCFKEHLAWCLYQQGHYDQAREWILKAADKGTSETARQLLSLIQGAELRRSQQAGIQRGRPAPRRDWPDATRH